MGILDKIFKPNVKKLKEKGDVEGLIKVLKSEADWHIREKAVDALGEIEDARAVEPLIWILENEDNDNYNREFAIDALGKIGDKRAIEPLIHALNDEDAGIMRRSVVALGRIGEAAVEPLIQTLKNEEVSVQAAADVLEEISWQPKDENERVYYLIVQKEWEKLVEVREAAVEPLIHALNDVNFDIRSAAAKALGKIGDVRAIEPLIHALDGPFECRLGAIRALGEIGDKRAVGPLIHALESGAGTQLYTFDRQYAAEALGEIGGARAVEALIWALEDTDVRYDAAKALGEIGDKRAVEYLIQALDSRVYVSDGNGYSNADFKNTVRTALEKIDAKKS